MAIGTVLTVFFIWKNDLAKRIERDNKQDQQIIKIDARMDAIEIRSNETNEDVKRLLMKLNCQAHTEALKTLSSDNIRLDTRVDKLEIQVDSTSITVTETRVEIKNINGMVKALRVDQKEIDNKLTEVLSNVAVIAARV